MHMPTKYELRRIYREKRILMSAVELGRLNELLLNQVKQLSVEAFRTIHLFLPIAGNHEPDTYAIANWLRTEHPHIRLAISKSNPATSTMTSLLWEENTLLIENQWKIPEPEYGQTIEASEIDALFVPLLAFDRKGNRVGYGKGF